MNKTINGLFVKSVLTVTCGLLVVGIGAGVVVDFNTNAHLAAIDVHLESIYQRINDLEEDEQHSP